MNVLVERYQRRKNVSEEDSQVLYYVRQKSGTVRVMDVNKLADAIEANSSLTAIRLLARKKLKGGWMRCANVTTMQRIIAMHGVSARKERAFGPTTTGNLRRPPAGRSSDRCSRGK